MRLLKNASIKHKLELIILLTTASVLLLSLLLLMIVEINTARSETVTRLQSLALLLGANSSAAITFSDRNTANDILATLSTQQDVVKASITLNNGDNFAHYISEDFKENDNQDQDTTSLGSYFRMVSVNEPILLDGEIIGEISIRGNMSRAKSTLLRQSLMVMGVFIVSMIFAFWLSNRFQRVISIPVQQLLRTMKRIAVKRDFSHRAQRLSNDELGSLVDGFNAMLDRIQKHDRKLAAYHQDLERQVTERTREFNTAKNVAEAASQAKSDFLATMSHEIRTPMSGVIGFAHLLRKTSLSEQQTEYVDTIITSAQSLLEIIDDILNFSKMEAGKVSLECSSFVFQTLIHDVEVLFMLKAEEKGLTLTTTVADDVPPMLYGDSSRIRQILINLVGNAIKFTDEGSVSITIEKEEIKGDQVTLNIIVSDTGIGISKEQQLQLFQPFQQCDRSITRNYGGTGLGLVIAQRLAYLMNGEITLKSTPGVGSTFSVHISLAISNSSNLADNSRLRDGHETIQDSADIQEYTDALFKTLTILVVDDSQVNLTLAKTLLSKKGAEVTAVTSALEALQIIENQKFDLILMDLEMPRMSGIEAARKIRATQGTNLPIIAVTAHVLPQKRQDVLDAGMDDLLTKPYLPDQLYKIIAKWSGNDYAAPPHEPTLETDSDSDSAVYNLSTALASVAYDSRAADMIVNEFLEMIPDCESMLKQASLSGDLDALFQAAHKLEGSACTSGASQIYTEAVSLKETLSQESPESKKIEEHVATLLEQTKRFRDHLTSHARNN